MTDEDVKERLAKYGIRREMAYLVHDESKAEIIDEYQVVEDNLADTLSDEERKWFARLRRCMKAMPPELYVVVDYAGQFKAMHQDSFLAEAGWNRDSYRTILDDFSTKRVAGESEDI